VAAAALPTRRWFVRLWTNAALLTVVLSLGAPACGDCEYADVEARLDWKLVGSDEKGLTLGAVGPGNVPDYRPIEDAVMDPSKARGQLVGMMDAPRTGRLLLATFALTFPLAVGDVIVGNGPAGGGWGLLAAPQVNNGVTLTFDPPHNQGQETPVITQRLEVTGVNPLRMSLSWSQRVGSNMTSLTGEIVLERRSRRRACD
jgi:hypothetical protein